MAIENDDLLVLQKNGGGGLRKATVQALLNEVVFPAPPTVPEELDDLNDVDLSGGVDDGQILQYTGGSWGAVDLPEGADLSLYLEKPTDDGSFVVTKAGDTVGYSDTVDGGSTLCNSLIYTQDYYSCR